ncbi:MAG: hypothetical protein QNJ34_27340 [Xenococcaceae cyanobacterium MO_188.B29]|nr:hypothetical protein [Xenococcaceae cyanobacterium MO_188.B29]
MLNILIIKKKFFIQAIALGAILSTYSLPLNAQTNTSEYDFLKDNTTEANIDWNFSSEEESISIKDDLKELGEYSISEPDSDTEIVEEEQKWGNRGDVEDFSIETEVYDH